MAAMTQSLGKPCKDNFQQLQTNKPYSGTRETPKAIEKGGIDRHRAKPILETVSTC